MQSHGKGSSERADARVAWLALELAREPPRRPTLPWRALESATTSALPDPTTTDCFQVSIAEGALELSLGLQLSAHSWPPQVQSIEPHAQAFWTQHGVHAGDVLTAVDSDDLIRAAPSRVREWLARRPVLLTFARAWQKYKNPDRRDRTFAGSCVPSPAKAPVTIWELAGMRGPPKKRDIAGEEWDTADLLNLKPVEELQEEGRARTGWRAGWPYSDAEDTATAAALQGLRKDMESLKDAILSPSQGALSENVNLERVQWLEQRVKELEEHIRRLGKGDALQDSFALADGPGEDFPGEDSPGEDGLAQGNALMSPGTNTAGQTLLHKAALAGDVEDCLQLLRDSRFRGVNVVDSLKKTALHYAAQEELTSVCDAILRHPGFNAASQIDWAGATAFDLAVETNNSALISVFQKTSRSRQHHRHSERAGAALPSSARIGEAGQLWL
mmetsp:Transcript_42020/g.94460  ORF Transcript_42020/g.94460 Transcript_42020/m.94460 type:complete len:444 (-) Transcript_42020:8-1339(-)